MCYDFIVLKFGCCKFKKKNRIFFSNKFFWGQMYIELIRISFLYNKSSIVLYMEKKNNNILLLGIKEDNLIYLMY